MSTTTYTEQRDLALQRANEIRLARAELRRRIHDGEITVARVLLDPPAEAATWQVGQMLSAQRRWGTKRSRDFLSRNRVVETKPIGMLTERQRAVLARGTTAGKGER